MNRQKVNDFVNYLYANPNIGRNSAPLAELLIKQFISSNIKQLSPMFQTPQFFQGMDTSEVTSLILDEVEKRTISSIKKTISAEIEKIDFTFMTAGDKTGSFNAEMYRKYFTDFAFALADDGDCRPYFSPTVNMFQNKIIEKYLVEIFNKRTPLYFELVRIQRNNLSAMDYVNYLKLLILVRPLAFERKIIENFSPAEVNLNDFINIPSSLPKFIDMKSKTVYRNLPGVSQDFIKMSLKSLLKSQLLQPEDASAKFLYILCSRFNNYSEVRQADRGAETPDKSWFSIAKKGASELGFDRRYLDDLFIIAGNNGW